MSEDWAEWKQAWEMAAFLAVEIAASVFVAFLFPLWIVLLEDEMPPDALW